MRPEARHRHRDPGRRLSLPLTTLSQNTDGPPRRPGWAVSSATGPQTCVFSHLRTRAVSAAIPTPRRSSCSCAPRCIRRRSASGPRLAGAGCPFGTGSYRRRAYQPDMTRLQWAINAS
jgi:hypothetical protein